MAYLTIADFRTATVTDPCAGLTLTTNEAPDSLLTAGIARMSKRIDDLTDDHFESSSETLELDVRGVSSLLDLPKRTTAITTVKTRDQTGTLTTQSGLTPPRYRLRSSLDAAGALRLGDADSLEIVSDSGGLIVSGFTNWAWAYAWPEGPQTVQVVGTFGWTATPADIKRCLGLLTFYHFKPLRADLRMADSMSTADLSVRFGLTFPTGIPEADDIILNYQRFPVTVA